MNKCLNCNKLINKPSKKCKTCYIEYLKKSENNPMFGVRRFGKENPNYKNGISITRKICIDCGKKLGRSANYKGNNRCHRCAKFGSLNSSWKGGVYPLKMIIRCSLEYVNWRNECLNRDNYTCQECGQYGGKLNVDHKIPFSLIFENFLNMYSEYEPTKDKTILSKLAKKHDDFWDLNNGQTLCFECHKVTPTFAGNLLKNDQ